MVNVDVIVDALEKIGCSIESVGQNPQIYERGFDLYCYCYSNKERRRIERAIEVTWFAFKNRVISAAINKGKVTKGLWRYCISCGWPYEAEEKADEVGQLAIDVISSEISDPGSSPVVQYALDHADDIIKDLKVQAGLREADKDDSDQPMDQLPDDSGMDNQ